MSPPLSRRHSTLLVSVKMMRTRKNLWSLGHGVLFPQTPLDWQLQTHSWLTHGQIPLVPLPMFTFFSTRKKAKRVCVNTAGVCIYWTSLWSLDFFLHRELQEKDPDGFPSGWCWTYLPCTMNANLCNHILSNHLNTYLDKAEKRGWQIICELVWDTFTNGYTFATLHKVLHQPGVGIQSLPPVLNHPQPSFPGTPPLTSLEDGLPPYSQATLHEHIIRFILSDDQVHLLHIHVWTQ